MLCKRIDSLFTLAKSWQYNKSHLPMDRLIDFLWEYTVKLGVSTAGADFEEITRDVVQQHPKLLEAFTQ